LKLKKIYKFNKIISVLFVLPKFLSDLIKIFTQNFWQQNQKKKKKKKKKKRTILREIPLLFQKI